MDIQAAIKSVTERNNLSAEEMEQVMRQVMTGEATSAQIGGFLIGLRMKGETVEEIAAAAKVMRSLASHVKVSGRHVVDTCGTGGDGSGIFNVSTASAIVCAAAGAKVAKHGNRSVSSKSGSADLLEAAGVNLELTPEQVGRCIDDVGVGFLFAPKHHSAMKHAIGPRREMGVRTVFNLLGPLTNPASAPNQVLGVFSADWVNPLAEVLRKLGSQHVMVVHANDGLDEISIANTTQVAELNNGEITEYVINPSDFGIPVQPIKAIQVDSAAQSLALIQSAFAGGQGPAQDMIALNAGAAIYVAGLVDSMATGVEKAKALMNDGSAAKKLQHLIHYTQHAND